MEKFSFLFRLLPLLLFVASVSTSAQVSNDNEDAVNKIAQGAASRYDFVPGQVLVKFKDASSVSIQSKSKSVSASVKSVDAVLKAFGATKMEKVLPNEKPNRPLARSKAYNGQVIEDKNLSQLYEVQIPSAAPDSTVMLADQLKALNEVEFAEPNYKVYIMADVETTDEVIAATEANPFTSQQWGLERYGVKTLWQQPILNKKRPVIAILDTGVDTEHPDLVDNLWTNQAEADGESGYDNDNNGFKNDVHGWDFINNTGVIRDYNMHGTHVAGIAAASNNDIGIVGANPQALIMPITVMQSDGSGDVATIVKGIDYAVQNGATVLNLSLGTYANSRALRQALERAYQTVVIVAAAGNDGMQILPVCDPTKPYGPMFPAAYSFVLGVQATNQSDGLAGFSNYDCDGPNYSAVSSFQDPDGFNYELKAPGVDILSTIPGGKYKALNGTSMAAPLVAGAISALQMVKDYDSQEILWGDLLHTDNIAQAFRMSERPAELDLVKMQLRDRKELGEETEADYSDDGEVDAGETVTIYPVLRTTFGEASDITLRLAMGDEYEDASLVEFLTDEVDFGLHLDAYGRGVSLNPLKVKVANHVADRRHIKLKIQAFCNADPETVWEWPVTLVVNNVVKISGFIDKDSTLTADHVYYVNDDIGILEGVTFTIEPGTRLEFAKGKNITSFGTFISKGTPEKPIVFINRAGQGPWASIRVHQWDTISYCKLYNIRIDDNFVSGTGLHSPHMSNCVIELGQSHSYSLNAEGECNNYINNINSSIGNAASLMKYTNIVNNSTNELNVLPNYSSMKWNNYFNNKERVTKYIISYIRNKPQINHSEFPSYLGTSREDFVRPYIYEMGNGGGFGKIDLSNMPDRPYAEAHGIVWKVMVNGKDAQDEYEDLAPLGVGRHKFEVYFNRPMNKAVAPQISFGVREPYTQQAVNEDGSWNEDGTIYTAYKTITGKTKSDGVNRIYVYGAEDNEYFEIPYEKTRFNVPIQAAGSMATGFAAEAGLGRVKLTWNNENNDFEDAMGFNVYRYGEPYQKIVGRDTIMVVDTVRLNQQILDIEATDYTDYEVTPGETYYYYYKVLSTDLQEYDISNVVAATPLTSTRGDANGSGDVDVADVITTVNYAAGMDPKPFIYEAADMNVDEDIDILDVIGIIQTILHPNQPVAALAEATATYTVENGTLYVESPVALAGVQVTVNARRDQPLTVADDLKGFENTSAWLSDNEYLMLAYNLNGKTLAPGKHALLHLGDAELSGLRLSDATGHNVLVELGESTGIEQVKANAKTQGVYNTAGMKVANFAKALKNQPKGVYIVDGVKVKR
ncbi:MAG: S8 family serine peptidase [Bacteroidaceae bacterium]|nr:S8 family serine peptidase [Bacteroidaceae bacterium]